MILEVGPIKGPKWGVNIEVAVERNGKVGVIKVSSHIMEVSSHVMEASSHVMEVSSHITEFFQDGGVCVEAVCVQRNVH